MRGVILTGAPGAGKTALLGELAALGYATVPESARALIAERVAVGLSPRPDPVTFARDILRRDMEKYRAQAPGAAWVFFDRGVIDALGLLQETAPLSPDDLAAMLSSYRFHPEVFILPPWEAIYATDTERDQSYADAVAVHEKLARWYVSCGYVLHEVSRLAITERAKYVLGRLAEHQHR
jgi:predicted ATPase